MAMHREAISGEGEEVTGLYWFLRARLMFVLEVVTAAKVLYGEDYALVLPVFDEIAGWEKEITRGGIGDAP